MLLAPGAEAAQRLCRAPAQVGLPSLPSSPSSPRCRSWALRGAWGALSPTLIWALSRRATSWAQAARSSRTLVSDSQDRRILKLERFLSKAGVLSRREAARRVRAGDVTVNKATVRDPFCPVHLWVDEVEVKGVGKVHLPDWDSMPPRLVLFNKPSDVVTSLRSVAREDATDNHLQPLQEVLPEPYRSLLAPHVPALRPVGRLDAASVGLLLFTDSSDLGNRLTGPGSCEKEYLVSVRGSPSEATLRKLQEGVYVRDGNTKRGKTLPCEVMVVRAESGRAVLRFVLREGRNRQIRRMCEDVKLPVEWLLRSRIGPLSLRGLGIGEARDATREEEEALSEALLEAAAAPQLG